MFDSEDEHEFDSCEKKKCILKHITTEHKHSTAVESTSDDARVGEMLVNVCPGVNGAVVFPRCILPNHCPMATGNTLVRKQEYCGTLNGMKPDPDVCKIGILE